MKHRGSVALVTGAGRGIGRAIARRFAAEGAVVAVNDVDEVNARRVSELLAQEGGRAITAAGDISSERDVERIVAEVMKELGALDILVNNAGVDLSASPEQTSLTEWDRLHGIDLRGAFLCAKKAQAALQRSSKAAIVNVSSIHAMATQPGRAAYAAAKAGLIGLTHALALDLGPTGIRVNAVLPGYIHTEIWKIWLDLVPDPDAHLARIAAQHPVRRLGTPEDVAAAVSFLASPEAGFISGTTLVVDGGLTAMFPSPPGS